MRDVAAAADVSLKTVSRVVNRERGVGLETAARVTDTIERLGFRRNDLARSLRPGQRTATIGLVVGDVGNPFFSGIARAVEQVARDEGHLVITGSSDEDPEHERELITTLCMRRVDGILLVPAGRDQRYLLPEIALGTAVVFLDRPPGGIPADAVVLDNVGGARRGVEHLLAQGHRRIALLRDSSTVLTARQRTSGYRAALAGAGLPVDERLLCSGLHDADDAHSAVRDLLTLDDPPTALFAVNNRMSLGALRALRDRDHPVALVGFDDLELADMLATPITVVAHDPAAMGATAARVLFRRLGGDTGPPRQIVLPTTLVPRGSGELAP
ncbi:MAG: LacI family transcriptional regulator [Actinomycetota bacterium]|nr:LacI family transcriptional regulator [Actinomycetota bacterium]